MLVVQSCYFVLPKWLGVKLYQTTPSEITHADFKLCIHVQSCPLEAVPIKDFSIVKFLIFLILHARDTAQTRLAVKAVASQDLN